jgi:hypothetical protein
MEVTKRKTRSDWTGLKPRDLVTNYNPATLGGAAGFSCVPKYFAGFAFISGIAANGLL